VVVGGGCNDQVLGAVVGGEDVAEVDVEGQTAPGVCSAVHGQLCAAAAWSTSAGVEPTMLQAG
jgi:hypothetical protein